MKALWLATRHRRGHPYHGCREQAWDLKPKLDGQTYDDTWTFAVIPVSFGTHWIVMGISSDPCDPIFFLDAWKDIVDEHPSRH